MQPAVLWRDHCRQVMALFVTVRTGLSDMFIQPHGTRASKKIAKSESLGSAIMSILVLWVEAGTEWSELVRKTMELVSTVVAICSTGLVSLENPRQESVFSGKAKAMTESLEFLTRVGGAAYTGVIQLAKGSLLVCSEHVGLGRAQGCLARMIPVEMLS